MPERSKPVHSWGNEMKKLPAKCHPDRVNFGRGLCYICYIKEPDQRARVNAYKMKRYHAEPEVRKALAISRKRSELKRLYGLTMEQYHQMLEQQNGRCAICKSLPGKRRLDVDHNHITNAVRGLLCSRCNRMLGAAHDRADVLRLAIRYLSQYEKAKHDLQIALYEKEFTPLVPR